MIRKKEKMTKNNKIINKKNRLCFKINGIYFIRIVFNSKNYKAVDSKNNFEGDFIVNLKGEFFEVDEVYIALKNDENKNEEELLKTWKNIIQMAYNIKIKTNLLNM